MGAPNHTAGAGERLVDFTAETVEHFLVELTVELGLAHSLVPRSGASLERHQSVLAAWATRRGVAQSRGPLAAAAAALPQGAPSPCWRSCTRTVPRAPSSWRRRSMRSGVFA